MDQSGAVGIFGWRANTIKFQADMGLLLPCMFFRGMLGALVLLPAFVHFLLKPSALQRSVKASVQLAGETA